MSVETYTPDEVKRITTYSNTIAASQQFNAILEESGAALMTVYFGEGKDKQQVILTRRYIEDLNRIGGGLYFNLIDHGFTDVAVNLLEQFGAPQVVDTERLMKIDRWIDLLDEK